MRVFGVLVVSMLLLVSCGGQRASAPETPEKKNVEEAAGGIEPTAIEASEESTAGQEGPETTMAVGKSCSDFYGPQDAQAYFDSDATPQERRNLDADGDGLVCNEGAIMWKLEPETTTMSSAEADAAKAAAAQQDITLEELNNIDSGTSYGEQLVIGLGNCQLIKYQTENGEQALNEWTDEFVDEVAEAPAGQVPSIQEEMIRMGYSCTVPEALAGMPAEE